MGVVVVQLAFAQRLGTGLGDGCLDGGVVLLDIFFHGDRHAWRCGVGGICPGKKGLDDSSALNVFFLEDSKNTTDVVGERFVLFPPCFMDDEVVGVL